MTSVVARWGLFRMLYWLFLNVEGYSPGGIWALTTCAGLFRALYGSLRNANDSSHGPFRNAKGSFSDVEAPPFLGAD